MRSGCWLRRDIARDEVLRFDDVVLPPGRLADRLWREQMARFARLFGELEGNVFADAKGRTLYKWLFKPARVGASGWPQPEAEVKLIDAQGREVGQGETGEVCIRAANLMRGYWNAESQAGVGLQDGWFHSGDLGERAADGCLTIVGRSKDMIISGGENIYPAEIENLLVTLPGVSECAVIGLPDARWGEVPVAVLVRSADAAGQALSEAQVLSHLQARIARFKLPRRVVWRDQLPKSALGKVQKPALQAQLLAAQSL